MKTDAMTQENQAEAEIQRLNSELDAANQNLEAFNYSVSHDLRAPLRHILGFVGILQAAAGRTLDESTRQHLQIIAQSAARMERMFDALTEFSRIGQAEMHFAQTSLAALVEDVRRDFRGEIKGRDIEWQIGDLPEVTGDPTMLRQAVVNLLSNAIKYSRTRRKAKIAIGATNGEHETICFVRDNGVGFDMKCADRLFGMFQRFHRSEEFAGTGAGLATVRRIVSRHGGRTWAEGKTGGGATFYFSIPKPPEETP